MQRWKIILKKMALITLSVVGTISFFVLITSATEKQKTLPCNGVLVHIDYQSGLSFMNEKEVIDKIQFVCKDSIQKLKAYNLNIQSIEAALKKMPYVDSTEVFLNQKQVLNVVIKQKRPIIRIINNNGVSYYLSDKNQVMPLCSNFTARVPIALGEVISNGFEKRDSMVQLGLFKLTTELNKDTFLSALIDQFVVDSKGEVTLVPLSGEHTVLFGFAQQNTHEKLKRLKIFYKDVLPRVGWSVYEKLNVKFDNQMVCVKKQLKPVIARDSTVAISDAIKIN